MTTFRPISIPTGAEPPPAPPAADLDIEVSSDHPSAGLVNLGSAVRTSWPFSLDAIRQNIAYMNEEAQELLVWAFTWCIDTDHPIRREEFCDRVDYSMNAIYKVYSGKYKHPNSGELMDAPAKLVKNLRDFRRIELSRAKLGRQLFIHTPTAKRIYWAIEQARRSRRPVMIYGGSQLGKTETFKENCIDFNHGKTVLIEIQAVGKRGLLQYIATKLGVSTSGEDKDLTDRIVNALTPDTVLILDEVHLLANVIRRGSFFMCMETIRRIWDAAKCGLVLSYTDLGYNKAEQERKRELVQIFRRGVLRVNLGPAPKVEDVKAIVKGSGLDWDDVHDEIIIAKGVGDTPYKALKQLSVDLGLTAIIERVRMAHELAADQKRDQLTWKDFLTAHFAINQQAETPKTGWES